MKFAMIFAGACAVFLAHPDCFADSPAVVDMPSSPLMPLKKSVKKVHKDVATLSLPQVLAVGVSTSIEYQINLKIVLEVMAAQDSDSMTRLDPVTYHVLPDVRPGRPMVAHCKVESAAEYSREVKAGLQIFGSGVSDQMTEIESAERSLEFPYWQVDGSEDLDQMLERHCVGQTTPVAVQSLKPDIELALRGVLLEKFLKLHFVDGSCTPSPELDSPDGDAACKTWFENTVDSAQQKLLVPRCLADAQGKPHCELRARENSSCAMYWDRQKKRSGPKRQRWQTSPKVTSAPVEFPCDTRQNLECRIVHEPVMLFNVPVIYGSARCAAGTGPNP